MEKENKREAGTKHCRTDMGGGLGDWLGKEEERLRSGTVCMYV